MSTWGSSIHHKRECVPASRLRRRCVCGCATKATHRGMANGVCLIDGCEWSVRRWVHDQDMVALALRSAR